MIRFDQVFRSGIELIDRVQGEFIIAKCAQDVQLSGKVIRQGKVLKSVYYRPAELHSLVSA